MITTHAKTAIASIIINVVSNPGTRLVLHSEGGFQLEKYVNGIGWTLDNDALTDQECAVVLESVARIANYASKNA